MVWLYWLQDRDSMLNWYTINHTTTLHTHNETQWPTAACQWHFVLPDIWKNTKICRALCIFQQEEIWTYSNQRQSPLIFKTMFCMILNWHNFMIFAADFPTNLSWHQLHVFTPKLNQLKLVQNHFWKTNGLYKYLTNVMATLVLLRLYKMHCVVR